MGMASLPDGVLSPIRLGPLDLPNRVVMAPMSRRRAAPGGLATALMAMYYAQRATAGLLITEATWVAPRGAGSAGAPGVHDDSHVAAWRQVTDAVHAHGGRIFLQLWHAGRATHPALLPAGVAPVAPSAVAPAGTIATPTGREPFVVPHALEIEEIRAIVGEFARAARRARDARFDGVELHAAQGFLIDQFLRDGTNRRSDAYGGSVERRVRFLQEVTQAVCGAWGEQRVGVQLSPTSTLFDMADSDPAATFGHAAESLNRFALAYLHVVEPPDQTGPATQSITPLLRARFRGVLIVNGGYGKDSADRAVGSGAADLVSFGRPFIANPDLPQQFAAGAPLAKPDPSTFYGGDARGYTDYPRFADA
jgi:N-ethylmaleimide reductase